eukprot:gb/GECH01013070.1/.p1 GENE.gb/GECH01013070.1/~~gb/GECH01013070.1/.p1  ORF type:complete len:427 (+),score=99.69 gb/GECH01013070.1/:1-1281(+)
MDVNAIVLDNGSGISKAGYTGDDAPRAVFSSTLGLQQQQQIKHHNNNNNNKKKINNNKNNYFHEYYVGDDAQQYRDMLSIHYPIEHGVVTDWDLMEALWHHMFYNDLRVAPEEHPVLLTEAPLNPKVNRETMTEIMFETFNIPATYVSLPPLLALFASGRGRGLVLDVGDGVTSVLPIWENQVLTPAMQRIDFGGRDITERLMVDLNNKRNNWGYSFVTSAEREIVREIKEKLCYVPCDRYSNNNAIIEKGKDSSSISSVSSMIKKKYDLPDGSSIEVNEELTRSPELLFTLHDNENYDDARRGEREGSDENNEINNYKYTGIHTMIHESIQKCEIDLRKDFYMNIILSGGTTLLEGISERLEKELNHLLTLNSISGSVKIITPPERKYSVWIGGSILASLSSFSSMWVTKEEFEESGSHSILSRF